MIKMLHHILLAGALSVAVIYPAHALDPEGDLANSLLGPMIDQALMYYNAPFSGQYTFSGTVPCAWDVNECAAQGWPDTYAVQEPALSLFACVLYQERAFILSQINPGVVANCIPAPPLRAGATSYAYWGHKACDSGLFCFNGWTPFEPSGLSRGGCIGLMLAAGGHQNSAGLIVANGGPGGGVCVPDVNQTQ